ncbi:HNH endonuclease [Shinella curvata]|uniref:HNH endonuclease n=1 Tax=Shinella curvata TaxID=1817964 RepID=A0ABT8XJE9_9HYPH|nr:HNH endonuclease [Shinella curvata]MCJ8052772.1 HNH endonuclease [Shinella curvata]MDO6123852.1 HNH endonuclease [Shinella curvata]
MAAAVGHEVAAITNLGDGWPSRLTVTTSTGDRPVAAHLSKTSSHNRKDYEWRFQNPANSQAVEEPEGHKPLLIGIDETTGQQILVVVDGTSRVGRTARFSILFNHRIVQEASQNGWSQYTSNTGEQIFALRPRLLPALLEMLDNHVIIPTAQVSDAAKAAGVIEENDAESGERARRTISSYVRDAAFSKKVKQAYGHRCAMCGLKLGLLAGAHIYPVSAPGSEDEVWNGVPLCHNHHAAYDAHQLWFDNEYRIHIKPEFLAAAHDDESSRRFIDQTLSELIVPEQAESRPRGAMIKARRDYYPLEYDWLPN